MALHQKEIDFHMENAHFMCLKCTKFQKGSSDLEKHKRHCCDVSMLRPDIVRSIIFTINITKYVFQNNKY